MKTDFEKVYPKMTEEERNEYLFLSMCGFYDRQNNTVLMGSEAYDRVIEYRQKMVDKYLSTIVENPKIVKKVHKPVKNRYQNPYRK